MREASEALPRAVLLVDRPAIRRVLEATGLFLPGEIALVCIDGTPRPRVTSLRRAFRAGDRAAVLYLHDASTVVYPFAIEPIATLVAASTASTPLVYKDLGLPPGGATARRFRDPTLPGSEVIMDLLGIPATTLARYCLEAAELGLPSPTR